uniref:Transcription factor CBF/NF-Y/archaeal histone domain-containing protein n=1 Tax=Oryza meridionalis TaxID=40149 RepID=A0A0E0BYA9_9ORYZ
MAAAAVADEVTEAMEQVEGEREEADAVADEAAEVMEQAEGEWEEANAMADEAAEAMEPEGEREEEEEADAVADEAAEAMEPEGEREEEEEADAVTDEAAEAMEQVDAVADEATKPMEQVEGEGEDGDAAAQRPALPLGRVKRIIRVDRDIKKVTNEAALLIAAATELFLGSLAAGAHRAASRRGRRAVRAVHVRAAAREHRPTADFLLDCLPAAEEAAPARAAAAGPRGGGGRGEAKPLPRGTRRIDAFFQKTT